MASQPQPVNSPSAAPDTVVIGAAVGYTPEQIEPFVVSLRNTGYSGDLALIVDAALGRALRRRPDYREVILRTVPRYVPWRYRFSDRPSRHSWRVWGWLQRLGAAAFAGIERLPVGEARRRLLTHQLAQHLYPPTETRYFHYHRFLATRRYSRVLISDVRDVLFQSDPFAHLPAAGLATGIETLRYTLATQPFNRTQIVRAYGNAGLARIGDQPVSCCGVTYGDSASMRRYLELMMAEILSYNREAARWPMDQAPHNYILWTGRFGDFHELHSLASTLATLGMHQEAELKLSPAGRLLNGDGSEPSIVHQYDRWPELERALLPTLAGSSRS
jgi:hypothetical protein